MATDQAVRSRRRSSPARSDPAVLDIDEIARAALSLFVTGWLAAPMVGCGKAPSSRESGLPLDAQIDADRGGGGVAAPPCVELGSAACAAREDCWSLVGRRYDEAHACMLPEEPLGCLDEDDGCGAAVTYALSPTGKCYEFPSLCVPVNWRAVRHLDGYPRCPPPDQESEHYCDQDGGGG